MAIPKVIKNFNLTVDGQGFAGKVDEVSLPELAITTEEHRAGGMDAPILLDQGMNLMELGFTLAEHSPIIFRQFGLLNQNAVALTFRAVMADDQSAIPYVINCTGMYSTNTLGAISNGQKSPLEATVACRYFKMSIDGEEIIEIDVPNMVRRINGVDQLEAQRNALGI